MNQLQTWGKWNIWLEYLTVSLYAFNYIIEIHKLHNFYTKEK